jgi:SAM-dependent methyltransferase
MLEMARKNCEDAGVKYDIRKMDAQHLEFDDGTFDLIVSRKVLWNLPEPVGAYKEWLRVLKPDGKMILFDANWWLHFYDQEYKDLQDSKMEIMKEKLKDVEDIPEPGEDYPHVYQGADPRILWEFAKELPLSKHRRPSWDVQTLSELGARSIAVDIDHSSPAPNGDGRMLPDSFVLTISKEQN